MNDCIYFSLTAWKKRLAAAVSRFMAAKPSDSRLGPETEPMKERLRASQRRWSEWNEADCDMGSGTRADGTPYTFDKVLCLSDHTAVRAMEIENQVNFWLS